MAPFSTVQPADSSLQAVINKNSNEPAINRQLALNEIGNYRDHLHIYTDASRTVTDKTGAAFYIPSHNIETYFKLQPETSIYNAELTAIKTTLEFIQTTDINNRDIALFTDSLSAVKSLEKDSRQHCTVETEIAGLTANLQQRQINVKIIWIPGHVGVDGNERADQLAKTAAEKHTTDIIHTHQTLRDVYRKIDESVEKMWQGSYNKSPTGRHYKQLEPTVSRKLKYSTHNRHKEVIITRLRLGKCGLNHYLHRINRHETGNCSYCSIPETIHHFLLECPHSDIFRSTSTSIRDALTMSANIDKIYNRIRQLQRHI